MKYMGNKKTVADVIMFLETVVMPRLERSFEKDEAYSHFDRLYKEYENLSQEFTFTKAAVKRLEDDRATKAELKIVEGRVVNLEQKVNSLERSLGNINN